MGDIRKFSPHVRWSDTEVAVIAQHFARAPWPELLALLPTRSKSQVQNKANLMGLQRVKPLRRSPAEVLAAKRAHMARRRAADPEAARAYQRAQHTKNKAARNAALREWNRAHFFRARANKVDASARELARMWKSQRGKCALTGRRLDRSAQLDHILPKAKGGGDEITNLRWVCAEVNLAKRDMTDEQLIALCGDVMRWIGSRIDAVEKLRTELRIAA